MKHVPLICYVKLPSEFIIATETFLNDSDEETKVSVVLKITGDMLTDDEKALAFIMQSSHKFYNKLREEYNVTCSEFSKDAVKDIYLGLKV